MFKLGEVKPPNDQDFDYVKDLCVNHAEWDLEVSKTNLKIWAKNNSLSTFRMIKIKADLENVNSNNLFDVLLYTFFYSKHYQPNLHIPPIIFRIYNIILYF